MVAQGDLSNLRSGALNQACASVLLVWDVCVGSVESGVCGEMLMSDQAIKVGHCYYALWRLSPPIMGKQRKWTNESSGGPGGIE